MSIGISADQVELADTLRKWAASLDPVAAVRAGEGDVAADFASIWAAVEEMGTHAIAVPEPAGGGGTVLDQAIALEACAHELVPGGLLGAAIGSRLTGRPGRYGVQVRPGGVVWDGGAAAESLLLGLLGDAGELSPEHGIDPSARHARAAWRSSGSGPSPRLLAVTLAAAEAAGVARWCLETAVDYAKVREQFGQRIGAFQAIKHLCAEMLETAESVTAAAWDVACAAERGLARLAVATGWRPEDGQVIGPGGNSLSRVRIDDRLADRAARVERAVGILEHHLHVAAARPKPTFDFTAPMAHHPSPPPVPNASRSAVTSIGSPSGVPVPCACT